MYRRARSAVESSQVASEVRAAGVQVLTVPTDVTNPDARNALVATALRTFGSVDVLVNNAGGDLQREFHHYTAHDADKQGDVRAIFLMARMRDQDCLATLRSLMIPGTQNGEVSSELLPLLRSVCLLGAAPEDMLEQQGWRPLFFDEMVAAGAMVSEDELRVR
ncbi:MAG TPA: SDR family NAD(P)-dependent oxidoreductase [Ktedonobacteraceae bacterium]|nr:SDR family NAD(P)-dependent oxidoreductase [Ktedonobacteraceae bacterium]